jgi:hypothetical protein
MLYLRNTNQQQTLGNGIQRGITSTCCSPTLNSVVTASLTQLVVNSTFGEYLINCKSCVGGYIQVTENSGSTWTTINPENCSITNLVPMPSQSAYYRTFTSCSSNDQPFDPLTSSFSNEIQFIPNGYVNYDFNEESGISGRFKLYKNEELVVDVTESVAATYWNMPSASMATASIEAVNVPLTGSTSMSLWVTGSNVSYYTSSCIQSGGIFLDDWKIIPNQFYDVTASINFRPENSCTASNYADLGYTVNSYDQTTGRWYNADQYGMPNTSSQYPYATLVGASTATKTNVVSGDCRFNAIQFSGSMTMDVGSGSFGAVYLAIETGSFAIGGVNKARPGNQGWGLGVKYEKTGSIVAQNYTLNNATTKNALVGMGIGAYIPASQATEAKLYVSGSLIAVNPPEFDGGPWNFGYVLTLEGEGIIRGFGLGVGTTQMQEQYNCIYETTPSK